MKLHPTTSISLNDRDREGLREARKLLVNGDFDFLCTALDVAIGEKDSEGLRSFIAYALGPDCVILEKWIQKNNDAFDYKSVNYTQARLAWIDWMLNQEYGYGNRV